MEYRTKKLTNKEFNRLARQHNDDIIDLYEIFFLLTDSQVEKLSEDDSSRYDNYQEELRCLMAEAVAEFG